MTTCRGRSCTRVGLYYLCGTAANMRLLTVFYIPRYSKKANKSGATAISLRNVKSVDIGKGSAAFRAHKKAQSMKPRHCMTIVTPERTYDFKFEHARACIDVGAALKRVTVMRKAVNRWNRVRTNVGAAAAFGGFPLQSS